MNKLFVQNTPIDNLHYANEDISDTISKMLSSLDTKVNEFTDMLKNVIPTVKAALGASSDSIDIPEITPLNKDQSKFIKIVSIYPYSELKEIKAFKPEGLNVNYLEFINILESQIDYLLTFEKDVLDPYELFLGQLVSDSKTFSSLNTNDSYYSKIQARRNNAYELLAKCYKKDSVESVTIIGKVIDRNADWTITLSKLNKLLEDVSKINRKSIQSKIANCEEYLDILLKNKETEETEETNVSPEVLRHLTNSTYQIAKEVEFLSIAYFRVLTLKGSIENTIEQVKKVYS
jgi:hypothetical protein